MPCCAARLQELMIIMALNNKKCVNETIYESDIGKMELLKLKEKLVMALKEAPDRCVDV